MHETPLAVAVLLAFALSGADVPVRAGGEQEAGRPVTEPTPQSDPCRNLWLLVGGSYFNGDLVTCHGSTSAEKGKVAGFVGDGPWPPREPLFTNCENGQTLEVVVLDKPDMEVQLRLFEWNGSTPSETLPRELKHWRQPAALRTRWVCDVPAGRYLLTAYVHGSGVGIERSFGLEVKK